jgi:hypothetical protein
LKELLLPGLRDQAARTAVLLFRCFCLKKSTSVAGDFF